MKTINRYTVRILIVLLSSFFIISCSKDEDTTNTNETEGLVKVKELADEDYLFSIYTKKGILTDGYNEIYIQTNRKNTNENVDNLSLEWQPMMHMLTKTHSCPYSAISQVANKSLQKGYIIFQMASNDQEYWELNLTYTTQLGVTKKLTERIHVSLSDKRRINSFNGIDGIRYVLAMDAPTSPVVGINKMNTYLYRMIDMETFEIVENYTIRIDPRMPSMGNHGSPNNIDLTYNSTNIDYEGKLSLTMTGYWKINLMLLDTNNQIQKGEEVTDTNESSSIFFEIEF